MSEEKSFAPAPRRAVAKRVPTKSAVEAPSVATRQTLAPWVVAVAAVAILALVVFGVVSLPGRSTQPWNAVFLANGQTYFGHIIRQTPQTVVLRDVYYLQAAPTTDKTADAANTPNVTLVKLGKELHGPTNEMQINRSNVLFTEDLRNDASVVQAIYAMMAQEEASQQSAPSPSEGVPDQEAPTTTP